MSAAPAVHTERKPKPRHVDWSKVPVSFVGQPDPQALMVVREMMAEYPPQLHGGEDAQA